jgi:hypothetical protein
MCYQQVASYSSNATSTKETEMATLNMTDRVNPRVGTTTIRVLLVSLTLATAAIHASLGGLLFLANAVGYTILAVAMIAPGPIGQVRWLVRLALMGFATATIGGWVLFGARFQLAYFDKAIELVLVAVVALELWRSDGGPFGVAREARRLAARITGTQVARVRK